MYILNISFMVSAPAHGNWYAFMTDKFIPHLEQEQKIEKIIFSRVLSEEIEQGFTYSLQMQVEEIKDCAFLKRELLMQYTDFATKLFDTEVMHFASIMKIVIDK